jgi:Tfp pilus assembly protein PilE
MKSIRHVAANRSGGFTLIELLNIVAIIALILGLLHPAMQVFREELARMQAENNLRQLKNAFYAFHDHNGRFPPAWSQGQWHWPGQQLLAEPIAPGITASDTLVIDQDGNITTSRTPGAEEARRQMIDNLRATGAQTITELLNMDRSALPVVGSFDCRNAIIQPGVISEK